jgi:hypothetical protein
MKPILVAIKSKLKQIIVVITVSGICLTAFLIVTDDQEVFIESQESKTVTDVPVFNKIKFFQFKNKDVWMMNQSHHGSVAGEKDWDRLAIVIDKSQSPKVAKFYQLEPGPLEWREGLVEKPFKVSCFICHNNGPRAIRPNYDSQFKAISFKERLKINYWNLRVMLYGRVIASPDHDEQDKNQSPPFRFRNSFENETLQVAVCVHCHKESGFMARGALHRQQFPTIKFMLESGQMPPPGFHISKKEKSEIDLFLKGF